MSRVLKLISSSAKWRDGRGLRRYASSRPAKGPQRVFPGADLGEHRDAIGELTLPQQGIGRFDRLREAKVRAGSTTAATPPSHSNQM
jgi:hypothetical protein